MNLHSLRLRLLRSHWFSVGSIGIIVRLSPAIIKYGKAYVDTRRHIRLAAKSPIFVEEWQKLRIAKALEDASKTDWGKSIRLEDSIRNVGDLGVLLSKLPTMTATEVSDVPSRYLTQELTEFDFCSTSGTSGKPRIFYLGKERGPIETAFVHAAWNACGFTHRSKRAVFRGTVNSSGTNSLILWKPELQELRISPFSLSPENLKEIWGQIQRKRIRYLHGYPSAIEALARWMAENPAAKKQASLIRGILSISERTYPHQNELFNSIFTNAKVVSFYGLSEKVAFATIDPDDSMTYHFSPIYGVTELLDDNFKPIVEPGKIGQLYSTGLLFTGTRFIRYELGDQAELVELPSRLNNYVLSVRNLESRWTARPAVGKNGELIHITSLNLHEPMMNYFSQMQFLQEKPGHLQISIIPNQKSSSKNLEDLRLMMQNLVGESLEVTVKTVGSLERNSRGKSPLLVVKSS